MTPRQETTLATLDAWLWLVKFWNANPNPFEVRSSKDRPWGKSTPGGTTPRTLTAVDCSDYMEKLSNQQSIYLLRVTYYPAFPLWHSIRIRFNILRGNHFGIPAGNLSVNGKWRCFLSSSWKPVHVQSSSVGKICAYHPSDTRANLLCISMRQLASWLRNPFITLLSLLGNSIRSANLQETDSIHFCLK